MARTSRAAKVIAGRRKSRWRNQAEKFRSPLCCACLVVHTRELFGPIVCDPVIVVLKEHTFRSCFFLAENSRSAWLGEHGKVVHVLIAVIVFLFVSSLELSSRDPVILRINYRLRTTFCPPVFKKYNSFLWQK